ncbi:hypothetical protein UlMin_006285 [Ulmus minor]
MSQTVTQFASGNEDKKIKDIIEKHYDETKGDINLPKFYYLISKIVEEVNKKFDNIQFKVPDIDTITDAYKRHHDPQQKSVSKEEFREILTEIWTSDPRFTGLLGAKDTLLYVFGVPLTALFLKQKLIPRFLPNEVFIPAITSLTVFVLAKLNKV